MVFLITTYAFASGVVPNRIVPEIAIEGFGLSQFQKEKWDTSPTYSLPTLVAEPSSFHIPFT